MTIGVGDKVATFTDSSGKRIALTLSAPGIGDKVAHVPTSGGQSIAIPLSSPGVGDTVVTSIDSSGKRIAITNKLFSPTQDPDYGRGILVRWNPDGTKLAVGWIYATIDGVYHKGGVLVYSVTGTALTELWECPGDFTPSGIEWSPSGGHLAITCESLSAPVIIYKVVGDVFTLCTVDYYPSTDIDGEFWAPDGSYLLVSGRGSPSLIERYDMDGTGLIFTTNVPARIYITGYLSSVMTISPDGLWLIVITADTVYNRNYLDIYKNTAGVFVPYQNTIAADSAGIIDRLIVSSDSAGIIIARPNSNTRLWRLNAGTWERLETSLPADFESPYIAHHICNTVSPQKFIAAIRHTESWIKIYQYDTPDTFTLTRSRQIATGSDIRSIQLSPDGTKYAGAFYNTGAVHVWE